MDKDLEILDEAIEVHLEASTKLGIFAKGLSVDKRGQLDNVVYSMMRLSTLHGVLAGRLSERIKEREEMKRN